MVAIIGGNSAGVLDSSLYLLNRKDNVGAAKTGNNEAIYANIANGSLVIQHTDSLLQAQGDDYALIRTYNSSGRLNGANRWTFSSMSLDLSQVAANKIILTNTDGSEFLFTRSNAANPFTSVDGAGAYQTIIYNKDAIPAEKIPANSYTLIRADQTRLTFSTSNSTAQLTSSIDTNGNRIDYELHSWGGIKSISYFDKAHSVTPIHKLIYGYSGITNNLTSVTDETGKLLVSYTYDAKNNLMFSVNFRTGQTTEYNYTLLSGGQYILESINLPSQFDPLLTNDDVGADAPQYLEWRKSEGVVYKAGDVGALDSNIGMGKSVKHLTAADKTLLQNAVNQRIRRISFEYTNVNKGTGNDSVTLSALIDAEGNRTEFQYAFSLSNGNYAGGKTTVVNALGVARATSNLEEYVNWRLAHNYYAAFTNPLAGSAEALQRDQILGAHSNAYTFNKNGAITSVTEPTGATAYYEYDGNENLIKIIDANADAITNKNLALGDTEYYLDLRKRLGYFNAQTGNGLLLAELTGAQVATLKDRFTTLMTYDDRGNLLSQRDGDGYLTSFTYTVFNKIETQTSALGNALIEKSKDSIFMQQKRLELGFINSLGKGKTWVELAANPADVAALKAIFTTTYSYSTDGKQNLVEVKSPGGVLTRFSNYDDFGNAQTKTVYTDSTDLVTASKQLITTYLYDAYGNNTQIKNADGGITRFTYDRFGNRLTMIDALNNQTTYTYDGNNRLFTVTDAEGNVTLNIYDAVGNLVSVSDAAGHRTYSVYDANNRLIQSINPSELGDSTKDRVVNYNYDLVGNQTSMSTTSAAGAQSTTYRFDEANRLVEVTAPPIPDPINGSLTNFTTRYEYDAVGNRVKVTDERDNSTYYSYNGNNLLVQTTDANQFITRYTYDPNRNTVEIISGAQLPAAQQRKKTFGYNTANLKISETDALGFSTTYEFDNLGRKTKAISALGNALVDVSKDNSYYKSLRKQLGIVSDVDSTLGKDAAALTASDIVLIRSAYSIEFDYTYNINGLLVTETQSTVTDPVTGLQIRPTIKHQFDKVGNEIITTDVKGKNTVYNFDKNNRVVMITDPNTVKTVFSYDSRGNRVSVQIGVIASYNATTKKITVTNNKTAEITLYEYNEFNQLKSKIAPQIYALLNFNDDTYAQRRITLGYPQDAALLTDAQKQEIIDSFGEIYNYDNVGNLTSSKNGSAITLYTYDYRNRLVQIREGVNTSADRRTQYRYDQNGNRIKVIAPDAYSLITSNAAFAVEIRGRLGIVYKPGMLGATPANYGTAKSYTHLTTADRLALTDAYTTSYTYDKLNRVEDSFVYDAAMVNNTLTSGSIRTSHNIYDAFGNLAQQVNGLDEKATRYYDKNNRLALSIDAEGFATQYTYDANGNLITQTLYDKAIAAAINPLTPPVPVATAGKDRTSRFTYDSANRLIESIDPEGYLSRLSYDEKGNVVQRARALDIAGTQWATTFHYYDAMNREVASISAEGYLTKKSYNAFGMITSVYTYDQRITPTAGATLPTPLAGDTWHATLYTYNAANQVIREARYTDSKNAILTDYTYDERGNRITTTIAATTAEEQKTQYTYDSANRLLTSTDAAGIRTRFVYDPQGNLVTRYDADGTPNQRFTRFAYNTRNLQTIETNALGIKTQTLYDSAGNVSSRTQAFGTNLANTETFTYDGNNRLKSRTNAASETTRYTYDGAGNRLTEVNANQDVLLTSDTQWALDFRKSIGIATASFANLTAADKVKIVNATTIFYTYDRDNQLILEVNQLGFKTKYTYDGAGNRRSMVQVQGVAAQERTFTYEYDKENRLVSVVNPIDVTNGVVRYGTTRYEYNVLGNQVKSIDSDQGVRTYSYDALGRVKTETDALGNALSESDEAYIIELRRQLGYKKSDGSGMLVSDLIAAGKQAAIRSLYTNAYAYDLRGNRVQMTDHNGTVTKYTYDLLDRQTSVTSAFGTALQATVSYEYDEFGNRIKFISANGNAISDNTNISTYYQDMRKALNVKGPDGQGVLATALTDDQKNKLRKLFTTQYIYNALNQLTYQIDEQGHITQKDYNALGLLASESIGYLTPQERKTYYHYDLSNRVWRIVDPANRERISEYDAIGNRVKLTDENGAETRYVYDARGRTLQVINALNGKTAYTYDALGNRLTMTDAKNNITKYSFDLANREIQITDAENRILSFSYDNRGNKITQVTAVGDATLAVTTTYSYDAEGHLLSTSVADANGYSISNVYDRDYNLIQSKDANGNITSVQFDALNRAIKVTDPLLNTTTYAYDANNNRIQITDALGGITQFAYDTRDSTLSETNALGNALASSDAPEYVAMRAAIDARFNKVAAALTAAEQAELRELYTTRYTYHATGEQLSIIDANKNVREFYYDSLGRLEKEFDPMGRALGYYKAYTYTQDVANKSVTTTQSIRFNNASIPDKNTTVYTYDALQRVIKITTPLANAAFDDVVEYTYDANGNRSQIKKGGVVTNTSYYDKTNRLQLSVDGEGFATKYVYDKNGNLSSTTLYGTAITSAINPATPPVVTAAAAKDQTTNFKYDKLNRVIEKTDGEGYLTRYTYDSLGNLKQQDLALDKAGTQWATTYRFYNKNNQEQWSVTAEGYLTEKRYDKLGQLKYLLTYDTKITVPADGTNPAPNAGDTWHASVYDYDAIGRVVREGQYLTNTEIIYNTFTYDEVGNRLSKTEAAGTADERTFRYEYDIANRLSKTISPAGAKSITTIYQYYEDNNVSDRTEDIGTFGAPGLTRRFHLEYDEKGRLTRESNPSVNRDGLLVNPVTLNEYDAQGNLSKRISAFGTLDQRTETFTYDNNGRVRTHTNAAGEVVSIKYDAAGNTIEETNGNYIPLTTLNDDAGDAAGTVVDYYRNWRKRLGIVGADTQGKYAADLTANDIKIIKNRTTIFSQYDRSNRRVQATDANGVITKFTYDGAGNKLSTTQAFGLLNQQRTTEYSYDKDNRITKVIDPLKFVTTYDTYDVFGNQKKITDANGNITTNTYDRLGRLASSISGGPTASAAQDIKTVNTYDKRGNLLTTTVSFANGSDARTTRYSYDLMNRKTRVTDGEEFSTSFEYDSFGNQTKIISGQYLVDPASAAYDPKKAGRVNVLTSSFIYDNANRLTSMTDGEGNITTYTYDLANNRLSMTEAANELYFTKARTTNYRYDNANRLSEIITPMGGITRYAYDAQGNKIKESMLQNKGGYTIPAGATWATVTDALYGAQTGSVQNQLINALLTYLQKDGQPVPDLVEGTQLNLAAMPASLAFQTQETIPVPAYYIVPANATPEKVIAALYTQTSPAGSPASSYLALQALAESGYTLPPLKAGDKLTGLPSTISTSEEVPIGQPAYTVTSNDKSWFDIFRNNYHYSASLTGGPPAPGYTWYEDPGFVLANGSPMPKTGTKLTEYDLPSDIDVLVDLGTTISTYTFARFPLKQEFETVNYQWKLKPLNTTEIKTTDWNFTLRSNQTWINQTYEYDSNKNLIAEIKPFGTTTTTNAYGMTYTYASGATRTEHYYDAMGNLIENRAAVGTSEQRSTWMEYDYNNRKIADLDGYKNKTVYTYDQLGNRIKVTNALGYESHFYYNSNNKLTLVIDPSGVTNSFVYDSAGNRTEEHLYNSFYTGTLNDFTAPALSATFKANDSNVTFAYDKANRQIVKKDADGAVTQTIFDSSGHIKEETLYAQVSGASPRKRFYYYDANGRIKTVQDVDNTKTYFAYDGAGNKTSEQIIQSNDGANWLRTTVFTYDLNNRRTRERFYVYGGPYLSDKGFEYDLVGNIISTRVATGFDTNTNNVASNWTFYSYDLNNQVISETQENGENTKFTYDRLGNRTSFTNGRNFITSYGYDLNNRLIKETKPEVSSYSIVKNANPGGADNFGKSQSFAPAIETVYDDVGNVVLKTDENGNQTYSYYNGSNLLVAQITAAHQLDNSKWPQTVNTNNGLTEFTYNTAGGVAEKFEYMVSLTKQNTGTTNPFKPNLHKSDNFKPAAPIPTNTDIRNTTTDLVRYTSYNYDKGGRLVSVTLPQIDVTNLVLADLNSVSTKITQNVKLTEQHIVDVYGDERVTIDRAGNRTRHDYDVNHRKIATLDSLGYLVTYTYDQQGNKTQEKHFTDPVTSQLTYLNNINLAIPIPSTGEVHTTDYTYDGASRLIRKTSPAISVFDGETRTSKIVRPTTFYTYDWAGNLLSVATGGTTTSASPTTYTLSTEYNFYDQSNRLKATLSADKIVTVYKYDAAGNKTSQTRYYTTYNKEVTAQTTWKDLEKAGVLGSTFIDSKNQTTVYEYDALNRLTTETETMNQNSKTDDLTKRYSYDAVGNRTFLMDEDGFITRSAFGANGKISHLITPNETQTLFEYDVVGNLINTYVGPVDSNVPLPNKVQASVNNNNLFLNFSWNGNIDSASSQDLRAWVVYDTVSHAGATSAEIDKEYPSSTQVQSVYNGSAIATLPLPTGVVYYRIVTSDGQGNNKSWGSEQSVQIPPRLTGVSAAQSGTNITVSATFSAALTKLPILVLKQPNSTQVNFVRVGSTTTYTATYSGSSSTAYEINWLDSTSQAYSYAQPQLSESSAPVAVKTDIEITAFDATNFAAALAVTIPSDYNQPVSAIQVKWRKPGETTYKINAESNATSDPIKATYLINIGSSSAPLNGDTYEIQVEAVKTNGQIELLDRLSPPTSPVSSQESISWTAKPIALAGNDQILVVGTGPVTTSRQMDSQGNATQRVQMDVSLSAGSSTNYFAYYGNRVNTQHSVTATATLDANSALSLNVSANLAGEYTNVNANGVHVRYAKTDSPNATFVDLKMTGSNGVYTANVFNGMPMATYQLEVYYTDKAGNTVIVERQRLVNLSSTFSGASLTVLATENGTLTKDALGQLKLEQSSYTGKLGAPTLAGSFNIYTKNTGGSIGHYSNGQTGYYSKSTYNALNDKISTNENDGIYREFGVNKNGVVVETRSYGTTKGISYISQYKEVDARGRVITDFSFLDADLALGMFKTNWTYNAYDQVLTKKSPTAASLQGQWDFEYNALGVKTKETDANRNSTYTYVNEAGQTTGMVAPSAINFKARYVYDSAGRLIKEYDSASNLTTFAYDLFGRKISETDGRGNFTADAVNSNDFKTLYTYDNRDRLIAKQDAIAWHLAYDDADIYDDERWRLGLIRFKKVSNTIVPLPAKGSELTTEERARIYSLYTTSYSYDGRNNRIETSIGAGTENQTRLQRFDSMNRLVESSVGNDFAKSMAPEKTHSLVVSTQNNTSDLTKKDLTFKLEIAKEIANIKDQRIELRLKNDTTEIIQLLTKDSTSDTFSTLVAGLTENTVFDFKIVYSDISASSKQVIVENQKINSSFSANFSNASVTIYSTETNSYDGFGNKISQTNADGTSKTWSFGGFGRLNTSTDEDGNITGYGYDTFGRANHEFSIIGGTEGSLKNITKIYTGNGQIREISDLITGIKTVNRYYDNGLLKSEEITTPIDSNTNGNHNRLANYYYDDAGQLTRWSSTGAYSGIDINYEYDSDGNRTRAYTSKGWNPFSKTPISGHRYDHQYIYDNAGRLTEEKNLVINRTTAKYTYDRANNRETFEDFEGTIANPTTLWTYTVDANNRVAQLKSTSSTRVLNYDTRGNLIIDRTTTGNRVNRTITTYDFTDHALTIDALDKTTTPASTPNTKDTVFIHSQTSTTNKYTEHGRLTQMVVKSGNTFTYNYEYYKDGREKTVTSNGKFTGSTTTEYDGNKNVIKIDRGHGSGLDGKDYSNFVTDNQGHIIYTYHSDGKNFNTDETLDYFYVNGSPVARIGYEFNSDGVAEQIAVIDTKSYSPVDPVEKAPGANGTYIVQEGDSLRGIANAFYGNPSLWYIIADANGIDVSQPLHEGTFLRIPATDQQGSITNLNHAIYKESDITGSSLPSLTAPPPPKPNKCLQITAIIVVVVIAIVAAVVTAGAASAASAAAVAAVSATGAAATAVTIGTFAVVGAVAAVATSLAQQTVQIGFGLQDDYSYSVENLRDDLIIGGITGAASGIGSVAKGAAAVGKLSKSASSIAKLSSAGLTVSAAAYTQLFAAGSSGKITSWTGLAGAAVSGWLSTSTNIGEGENALYKNGSLPFTQAMNAKVVASSLTANTFSRIVTPFAVLAGNALEQHKTPSSDEWVNTASSTLSVATDRFVNTQFEDTESFGARITKTAIGFGNSLALSGIYGANSAGRDAFITNSIGHEVGTFIESYLETGVTKLLENRTKKETPASTLKGGSTSTARRRLDEENPYNDPTYYDEDNQLAILEELHQENMADVRDQEIDAYFGQLAMQQNIEGEAQNATAFERRDGEGVWQFSERQLNSELGRKPSNSEIQHRMLEIGELNHLVDFNNMTGIDKLLVPNKGTSVAVTDSTMKNGGRSYAEYQESTARSNLAKEYLKSALSINLSYVDTFETQNANDIQDGIVKSVLHTIDYGNQSSIDITDSPSSVSYIGKRNTYRPDINLRITDADSGQTLINSYRNPYFDPKAVGTAPAPALIFSPGWSIENSVTPIDGNIYIPHSYDRELKLASAASRVGLGSLGVMGGIALSETGIGAVIGVPTALKGADEVATGTRLLGQYLNGDWGANTDNYFVKTLKWGGASDKTARIVDGITDIALAGGAFTAEKLAANSVSIMGNIELRSISNGKYFSESSQGFRSIANEESLNHTLLLSESKPNISPRRFYLNDKYNRSGNLDLDINMRGRQEVAFNFYRSQGYSAVDIPSHLQGIDFTKPVDVITINGNKSLYQFQTRGAPQGNYYAMQSNVRPTELGISDYGFNRTLNKIEPKIQVPYRTSQPVDTLKSTAARIIDTWSVKARPYHTKGGAIQLFSAQKQNFIPTGSGTFVAPSTNP